MFILSVLAAVVPASSACVPSERPDAPDAVRLGPDGRAHLLTADAESVCWWTVNEDGDSEIHRVWPLPGPHGVALVVLEDGTVLIALHAEDRWAVLRVDPSGEELAFSIVGGPELSGLRAEGRTLALEWTDGFTRRTTWVDADSGRPVTDRRSEGSPGAPQLRR